MEEYKVSLNSTPGSELASGRPLEPGEIVKLSTTEVKDDHNVSLIDNDTLLKVQKGGD